MRHGFRSRVWRELPFSARRAIVSTLRAVDRLDEWLAETWQSFQESPAWLLVAAAGVIGLLLTLWMLFFPPPPVTAQRLSATTNSPRPRPKQAHELDSRLEPFPPRTLARSEPVEIAPVQGVHVASHVAKPETDRTVKENSAVPSAGGTSLWGELAEWMNTLPSRTSQSTPRADVVEELAQDKQPGRPEVQPRVTFWRQTAAPRSGREAAPVQVRAVAVPVQTLTLETLPPRADGWTITQTRPPDERVLPARYPGEAVEGLETIVGLGTTSDEQEADPQDFPPHTEVALRLGWEAPPIVTPGQTYRTELVIKNLGAEVIRRLQVRENLSGLNIVTHAYPGGVVQGDWLERELRRLRPQRERRLELEWWPVPGERREYVAEVRAEALVAAVVHVETAAATSPPPREPEPDISAPPEPQPNTEPLPDDDHNPPDESAKRTDPPPAVEVAVQSTNWVRQSEVAEVTIEVRNTGGVLLHDVRIWADVPPSLMHRHGRQLEYLVGTLAPGETHTTVLRVLAKEAGLAVTSLRVKTAEEAEADAEVRLTVLAPRSSVESVRKPRLAIRQQSSDPETQVALAEPSL